MGEVTRGFNGEKTIVRWHSQMVDWIELPEDVSQDWLRSRAQERSADCLRLAGGVFRLSVPARDKNFRRIKTKMFEAQKTWDDKLRMFRIESDRKFWRTYADMDIQNYEDISVEILFGEALEDLKIYVSELWEIRNMEWFGDLPRLSRRMISHFLMAAGTECRGMAMEWQDEKSGVRT